MSKHSINTNSQYFKNTEKSTITPIQGKGISTNTFQEPLLIVVGWGEVIEFVYKTCSLFIRDHSIEIIPYDERKDENAQEIIQSYIELEKNQEVEPKIQEIIACNPHEYPTEKLVNQYI